MASSEFDDVHPILGAALRALPVGSRIPPPYGHSLPGPVPKLGADAQGRVARWCALQVRHAVISDKLGDFDAIIALAERHLAGERNIGLGPIAAKKRAKSGALAVAQLLASSLCARPDMVWNIVAAAVRRIIVILEASEHAAFIAGLDAEILRVECQVAVDKYAPEPAPTVARTVWRADRGNGIAGHFICTLSDGADFGLITKMKNRWRWFRGSPKDVLATVPDALFEEATAATAGVV